MVDPVFFWTTSGACSVQSRNSIMRFPTFFVEPIIGRPGFGRSSAGVRYSPVDPNPLLRLNVKSWPLLSAFVFVALAAPGPASAQIVNGSFESPVVSNFVQIAPGSAALPGWTVSDGSVRIRESSGSNGLAGSGNQYALLPAGTGSITLSQTLSGLVPGVAYRFSYQIAGIMVGPGPGVSSVEIAFNNQKMNAFDQAVAGDTPTVGDSDNPWNTQTFDATATATSHVLAFEINRVFRDPPASTGRPGISASAFLAA